MPKDKKKRRRYTKLRIDETSAVDRPAQEPAIAVAFLKRAEGLDAGAPSTTRKGYVADEPALTTAINGHTHIVDVSSQSGNSSYDGADESMHSHPYVITGGGQVVIGEAAGHTHEVEALASKTIAGDGEQPKNETMPETKNTKASETEQELNDRIASLEKSLSESTLLATLTAAAKAHLATLTGDDAQALMSASPEARHQAGEPVKAAQAAAAPVVSSSLPADAARQSVDPPLLAPTKPPP